MTNLKTHVYIVLPVHNRRELTLAFTECLKAQTSNDWTLVLVDDGCTDGTAQAVCEALGSRVSVVRGDGSLWWAGGVNAGLEQVRALGARLDDLLLLINDDVKFEPGFLEAGISALSGRGRTILLATSYDVSSGALVDSGSWICWPIFRIFRARRDQDINMAPSRGLLMRWDGMRTIGPFRADILPHYASDSEFTYRAWKLGWRYETSPGFALRVHTQETGFGRIEAEDTSTYWRSLFSMRSIHNPRTLTRLVLAACPPIFVIPALAKIWLGTAFRYFVFLLRREGLA